MPKSKAKMGFYAVKRGKEVGIFETWEQVQPLVTGFQGAMHKKFSTRAQAEEYLGKSVIQTISPVTNGTSNASHNTGIPPSRVKPYNKSPPAKPGSRGVGKDTDVLDESAWDVVYTDGACAGNGQKGSRAGVGVWWGHNDPRNLSERCPGDQTNNRAELIAIIRCLETTKHLPSSKPLLIKTDSSYSIQCIYDWLPNWRRNNFRTKDGKAVKNVGILLYLSHLLSERPKARLQHVKGHAGEEGNEGADALAVRGTWMEEVAERDWSFEGEYGEGGTGNERGGIKAAGSRKSGSVGKSRGTVPTTLKHGLDDYDDHGALLLSNEEIERLLRDGDS